ncbi:site-specific DNA-methyltransferase [Ammoniphilus sp. CFH 90114]|uniref:DNA-methyltransferase n=1 Tax=Ammoniphilus sp. CFH 90114 TaxID=2493665 RepID=UPI00100E8D5E|nr:site-specific DNA-methyltransferase [Ammoniphilus sp. CFH 90114]RXT08861.1 site-specific DNA-methyltransferase [Ammoniphilus sp. CFH 90114]
MENNKLFSTLNINNDTELKAFARRCNLTVKRLRFYAEEQILPSGDDLQRILVESGLTELQFKLKMGVLDSRILELIGEKYEEIAQLINEVNNNNQLNDNVEMEPNFYTDLGQLYQTDCLRLIESLPNESVDLIFADPPFNLNKMYESGINDKLTKEEYLRWTEKWVLGCVKLLKEGGSFFIWNIPKWNTFTSEILNKHLNFRNWIAVDVKNSLPIQNRLYPSHYSLLYYVKGERPNAYNAQRLPLEVCRHCGGDYRDYGGYKDRMNVNGVNLTDVWYDISPVRHGKYKTRGSNELSLKLLERIISFASNEGDTVFDPFGGSGTTYIVSEILRRNWIGSEIGPIDSIIRRFDDIQFHQEVINNIQSNKNVLFNDNTRHLRIMNNHWLPETLGNNN